MTQHRPFHAAVVRVWPLSHGVGPAFLVGLAVAVGLGALGTHAAGRRVAPRDVLVGELGQDPALLSPVLLSVACGLVALGLTDRMGWLSDVGARPMRRLRALWASVLVAVVLLLAAAAAPLVSPRTDAVHVYWSFLPLWLGCMLIGTCLAGRTAGTLAALVVCVAFSLRVVPWTANIVFNPALVEWRLGVGVTSLVLGVVVYAGRGARRTRGVGAAD